MATGSDQFISEVRIFPFQSVPSGWLPCEGQLLSIKDPAYQAIFSLIRNIYGGDGVNTFALPNFRGVVPTGTG
ncbi:MAG TPA: tail fiber protein, partial [Rudaea sp.]|nr:tail fiber protein [Rudaea sp.]